MAEHVIIDGNNLLHAMHAHAPIPYVARETMVKIIERWARKGDDEVSLVFDGPTPRGGLAQQMTSSRIMVQFSAPVTADDIIAKMIKRAPDPGRLRIVSSDTALRHEARHRRCGYTDAVTFIQHELFPPEGEAPRKITQTDEKPDEVSRQDTEEWLDIFGLGDDDDEPFDGHDAMTEH